MAVKYTLAFLLLSVTALATAQDDTTYTQISPPKMAVGVQYLYGGVGTPVQTAPCTVTAADGTCPTVEHANNDVLILNYNLNNTFVWEGNMTVSLKACFSKQWTVDRKWRAHNNLIRKDNQCNIKIADGLPAPNGTYEWAIPNDVPISTLFIQSYIKCQQPTGEYKFCTYGRSAGFFQVNPIDSRPTSMIIACAVCSAVGPLCLAAYLFYERMRKKDV